MGARAFTLWQQIPGVEYYRADRHQDNRKTRAKRNQQQQSKADSPECNGSEQKNESRLARNQPATGA